MIATGGWTPRRLALRAALVQIALGAILWLVLGSWNARHSWLLEPDQRRLLDVFFWKELPALGILAAVVLPVAWILRLADEASLAVSQDTAFLERILAYPRRVAVLDMAASVALFFFGAVQLRAVGQAPAIESAKIGAFGFLTGVLFGIMAYFLLQPAIRPLLVTAMSAGAQPPARAGFPLTQKVIACYLAISFVVAGLFGGLALSWAQRFAESSAAEDSLAELRSLAGEAGRERPRDAEGWKSFFRRHPKAGGTGVVFVADTYGHLLGSSPEKPGGPDGALLASADWRAAVGGIGLGSRPVRFGENRVVTSVPLSGTWRMIALRAPDRAVLQAFARAAVTVSLEILALSVLLAWAVGRGLARPLRDLEARTRHFGRNPEQPGAELPPADDEIGVLANSFVAMEEEIRAMQGQLRVTERRAATAELLAGVAHEVRNPLFGITSTAAALEGELKGDPRVREHLAVIRKESDRLSRMMEEMLSLQRAPMRPPEPVEIGAVVRTAADRIRPRYPSKSVRIEIEEAAAESLAQGDEERLESVFANVIENAVLASDGEVHIRCRTRREGPQIVVEVEDDGPGLTEEMLGRIFDPFVTGRPGGTGIGLALCRQIVADHGGAIDIRSRPGGPTIVSIALPAV